jgi:hypothetical protein
MQFLPQMYLLRMAMPASYTLIYPSLPTKNTIPDPQHAQRN